MFSVLFLGLCANGFAEQRYNPYTGQWEENSNTQTVNLNVNRPLTQQEQNNQLSANAGLVAGKIFGGAIEERVLYANTFGEKITFQNKQKPLSKLEMQRLQYYFQTKQDLWRKE